MNSTPGSWSCLCPCCLSNVFIGFAKTESIMYFPAFFRADTRLDGAIPLNTMAFSHEDGVCDVDIPRRWYSIHQSCYWYYDSLRRKHDDHVWLWGCPGAHLLLMLVHPPCGNDYRDIRQVHIKRDWLSALRGLGEPFHLHVLSRTCYRFGQRLALLNI